MKKGVGILVFLAFALFAFASECEGKTYTSKDFTYTRGEKGTAIITKYNGFASELTIPRKLGGRRVVGIGNSAFYECQSLTVVVLPKGVLTIGDYAFCNCDNLQRVLLPDSVTDIGYAAFFDCDNLLELTVPKGVKSIGYSAFGDCDMLAAINTDEENPVYGQIDGVLFEKTQHVLHTYPKGKTVEYYRVPDGTLSIGDYAINTVQSLKKITVSRDVINIGKCAFYCAFYLEEAELEDGLAIIQNNAFGYCRRLTTLCIPSSVTNIGKGAFEHCDQLVLTVIEGSTGQKYALENGIPSRLHE